MLLLSLGYNQNPLLKHVVDKEGENSKLDKNLAREQRYIRKTMNAYYNVHP